MLTNKFSICNRGIDPNKNFLSNAKIDNIYYIEQYFNTTFVDKPIDKDVVFHYFNKCQESIQESRPTSFVFKWSYTFN